MSSSSPIALRVSSKSPAESIRLRQYRLCQQPYVPYFSESRLLQRSVYKTTQHNAVTILMLNVHLIRRSSSLSLETHRQFEHIFNERPDANDKSVSKVSLALICPYSFYRLWVDVPATVTGNEMKKSCH